MNHDVEILRELARRYVDVCAKPVQGERRDLWRRHNGLRKTRPPVLVMFGDSWKEMPESKLVCTDPLFRTQEDILRRWLFQDTLGDDWIFEPWIEEWAAYVLPPNGRWGVEVKHVQAGVAGGAWKFDPVIREPEDIRKLVRPHHEIDEKRTAGKLARLRDAVGDIIPVKEVRAPYYRSFRGDISTDLAHLLGLEEMMMYMVDRPGWMHELLSLMRDAILDMHAAAERAGDWRLSDHLNQSMPYAMELEDPGAHDRPAPRRALWHFMASQETTLVSPEMFEEFMLQYQRPIMEQFGLCAYGCCEDLTRKISHLKRVQNLRRIAVTPVADVRACAEQIGSDYVISWRPNPALMVCCGWDPERVRRVLGEGLAACRGLHVDITLKDVQTVEGEPQRLREWVRIAREAADASA